MGSTPPVRFSNLTVLAREPKSSVLLARDEQTGCQVELRFWPSNHEAAEILKHLAALTSPYHLAPTDQVFTKDGIWITQHHESSAVSVQTWLMREHRLRFLEAVRLLSEVATLMEQAEGAGIRHGSLHPAGILWHESHALVIGLGACQAHGVPITAQDDLRAFGDLAFLVLTGVMPGTNVPRAPSFLRPHLPPGLSRAVVRCLGASQAENSITWHELSLLLRNLVTPDPGYRVDHLRDQAAWLRREGQEENAIRLELKAEKMLVKQRGAESARVSGIASPPT